MIFGEDGTDGHLGSGRGWEDLDDGVSDVGKEGKPEQGCGVLGLAMRGNGKGWVWRIY